MTVTVTVTGRETLKLDTPHTFENLQEVLDAIAASDSLGDEARNFEEHLAQLIADGEGDELVHLDGAADDPLTTAAVCRATTELMHNWAPSQWSEGFTPKDLRLNQDRMRVVRQWRRPRRQTFFGGWRQKGKHVESTAASPADLRHFRQTVDSSEEAPDSAAASVVQPDGPQLFFRTSSNYYPVENAIVMGTPLLRGFVRIKELESVQGLRVADWNGDLINVRIPESELENMPF